MGRPSWRRKKGTSKRRTITGVWRDVDTGGHRGTDLGYYVGKRSGTHYGVIRGGWSPEHREMALKRVMGGSSKSRVKVKLIGGPGSSNPRGLRGKNVGSFKTRSGSWSKGKGGRFVGSK